MTKTSTSPNPTTLRKCKTELKVRTAIKSGLYQDSGTSGDNPLFAP